MFTKFLCTNVRLRQKKVLSWAWKLEITTVFSPHLFVSLIFYLFFGKSFHGTVWIGNRFLFHHNKTQFTPWVEFFRPETNDEIIFTNEFNFEIIINIFHVLLKTSYLVYRKLLPATTLTHLSIITWNSDIFSRFIVKQRLFGIADLLRLSWMFVFMALLELVIQSKTSINYYSGAGDYYSDTIDASFKPLLPLWWNIRIGYIMDDLKIRLA